MDANTSPWLDVTFAGIVADLERRMMPAAGDAIMILERMQVDLQAALIVHELVPDRLAGAQIRDVLELRDTTELNNVELMALNEMSEAFPIHYDQMWEALINLEEGDPMMIAPGLVGCWWSYDEFDDLISNPENFDDGDSLLVFGKMMDAEAPANYWPEVAQRFGWPQDLAPRSAREYVESFDTDGFVKKLEQAGLAEFIPVFKIVWQETGCIFWDLNNDETGMGEMLVDFNPAGLRQCLDAWRGPGERYREAYNLAMGRLSRDGGRILEDVVKIWDACCVFSVGQKPKTLVEMWGDPMDEGAEVVDEFYGVIGGDDGEEDEE